MSSQVNSAASIRVKVIVTVFNRGEVLLAECIEPETQRRFHIPLGGGVEFGERLHDAAVRELYEEVGLADCPLEYAGFHESCFVYDSVAEHEIMFHFRCTISDKTRQTLPACGTESDGTPIRIGWYSASAVEAIRDTLVPPAIRTEILDRLRVSQNL